MVDLSEYADVFGDNVPLEDRLQAVYELTPLYNDEDYSGAAMLADLRENGFKIQNQLFYLERRLSLGEQNEYEAIRYFPNSYTPSDLDLGVNEGSQTEQYKFIYRVSHFDSNGEFSHYTEFGVETDTIGTIGDINAEGENYITQFYPQFGDHEWEVEVYKGFRKE